MRRRARRRIEVTVNGVRWREIEVRYAARCSVCNHPYPLRPGERAMYHIDGFTNEVVHIGCTPRDVSDAITRPSLTMV